MFVFCFLAKKELVYFVTWAPKLFTFDTPPCPCHCPIPHCLHSQLTQPMWFQVSVLICFAICCVVECFGHLFCSLFPDDIGHSGLQPCFDVKADLPPMLEALSFAFFIDHAKVFPTAHPFALPPQKHLSMEQSTSPPSCAALFLYPTFPTMASWRDGCLPPFSSDTSARKRR